MDSIAGFSVIAIIAGLTELAKRVGMPSRFASVAAVVFGVALSFLAGGITEATTVQGIVFGLSASGIWSGVKAMSGK